MLQKTSLICPAPAANPTCACNESVKTTATDERHCRAKHAPGMEARTFLCLNSSRYWRQYGRCCSALVIMALRHCVAASALLGACAAET